MKIYENPDKEFVKDIKKRIKDNGGHCPCQIEKTKDTKCMCKSLKEQESGYCHCGLYYKE